MCATRRSPSKTRRQILHSRQPLKTRLNHSYFLCSLSNVLKSKPSPKFSLWVWNRLSRSLFHEMYCCLIDEGTLQREFWFRRSHRSSESYDTKREILSSWLIDASSSNVFFKRFKTCSCLFLKSKYLILTCLSLINRYRNDFDIREQTGRQQ